MRLVYHFEGVHNVWLLSFWIYVTTFIFTPHTSFFPFSSATTSNNQVNQAIMDQSSSEPSVVDSVLFVNFTADTKYAHFHFDDDTSKSIHYNKFDGGAPTGFLVVYKAASGNLDRFRHYKKVPWDNFTGLDAMIDALLNAA